MVLKIKRITMLLEVDGSQFWDNVEFYNTDKGYHKWSMSNLTALARKRWAKNPNWGRCLTSYQRAKNKSSE